MINSSLLWWASCIAHKDAFANLNTLGGHNRSYLPGVGSDPVGSETYWDDLSYTQTTISEPSTLVLLGIGLVGLLAYAWRKRK